MGMGMNRGLQVLVTAVMLAQLAACGGGGGGSTAASPTPTPTPSPTPTPTPSPSPSGVGSEVPKADGCPPDKTVLGTAEATNVWVTRFCKPAATPTMWQPYVNAAIPSVTYAAPAGTATVASYTLSVPQFFTPDYTFGPAQALPSGASRSTVGTLTGSAYETGYDTNGGCPSTVSYCMGFVSFKSATGLVLSSADWGIWEHAYSGLLAGSNGGFAIRSVVPTTIPAKTFSGKMAAPVVLQSSVTAGVAGASGDVSVTVAGSGSAGTLSGSISNIMSKTGVLAAVSEGFSLRIDTSTIDTVNSTVKGTITQLDGSGNVVMLLGSPVTGRFEASFAGADGRELVGRFSIYAFVSTSTASTNKMLSGAFAAKAP